MGLMSILRRKADTWYWRARYWWFDTESGATARAGALVLSGLLVVVQSVRAVLAMNAPRPHPQQAIIWWVVYLIVVLIAAAIVYARAPKPQDQKPQQADPPSTDDGQPVIDILGTSWVSDYFVLAWKPNGVEKIKAKGKK